MDVAIPADINIVAKEREKIIKYQQLRLELEKLWSIKLTIIPIVIETLGSYTSNLHSYLTDLLRKCTTTFESGTSRICSHPSQSFRSP